MLPILTTIDDVRGIVRYLKNKPTGATSAEARSAVPKLVDPRKLTAFTFWAIIQKDGDRIKLAPKGWELARKPDQEVQIFRSVLDSIVPYHSALEWMHHQDLDAVTANDVANHWHEHHPDAVGKSNEVTLKDGAICFFHLCQASKLGTLKIGRRGQPTRLEIDKSKLKEHIESGPTSPPIEESTAETETGEAEPPTGSPTGPVGAELPIKAEGTDKGVRVFIAHGKNMKIVEQVQTMLELASITNEIAEEDETVAIPVPDKVFGAMHRCTAGVIVVSAEEGRKDLKGNLLLNENVLIEIGAAFVLYERRVILLWDKRLSVPSNLQGLYRCEFEGDELSWASGMKLMKGVQNFKGKST